MRRSFEPEIFGVRPGRVAAIVSPIALDDAIDYHFHTETDDTFGLYILVVGTGMRGPQEEPLQPTGRDRLNPITQHRSSHENEKGPRR